MSFECSGTVRMKLDKDRGFQVETNYDYLEIETNLTKNRYWGSFNSLSPDLRSGQWFDTNSSSVYLHFHTDEDVQLTGFSIQLLCENETRYVIKQGRS